MSEVDVVVGVGEEREAVRDVGECVGRAVSCAGVAGRMRERTSCREIRALRRLDSMLVSRRVVWTGLKSVQGQ